METMLCTEYFEIESCLLLNMKEAMGNLIFSETIHLRYNTDDIPPEKHYKYK